MTTGRLFAAAVALVIVACAPLDIDAAVDELSSAADPSPIVASTAPSAAQTTPATSAPSTADPRAAPPFRPPLDTEIVEVDRVVDGDTLVVTREDGTTDRVRLLRIDTPELARNGQPEECLARAATAQLERFAAPGTRLLLATDTEPRDQFDRLLAHVWREDDGLWVNGGMLATGFARVVTFPPNVAWDREVLALQSVARDRGVGLWSLC